MWGSVSNTAARLSSQHCHHSTILKNHCNPINQLEMTQELKEEMSWCSETRRTPQRSIICSSPLSRCTRTVFGTMNLNPPIQSSTFSASCPCFKAPVYTDDTTKTSFLSTLSRWTLKSRQVGRT